MEIVTEIVRARKAAAPAARNIAGLIRPLDVNSENIDELLDNMRHVTENLNEFCSTIKTRPYTLIRASNPRPHKPGEQQ